MQLVYQIKTKYDDLSKVSKASLWFIICGFMQRGISLITTPIFSRLFLTSEYGAYSVYNSWLEIVTIFATLKLSQGVYIQGLVKYDNDKERLSSSLLGLGTTWWAISFAIYLLFHSFWNNVFGLSTFFMICMFIMMLSGISFNFWSAEKRNEFQYIQLVRLTVLVSILKPAIGIIGVIATESFKVEVRIGTITIIEFIAYVGLFISIMHKGKQFYNKTYWKYGLAYNLPLVPHFLSQVVLNHSDRIMIQRMVGLSEAGIYSLAYSAAMILTMLNTSVQNAFRPWMFQKMKAGKEQDIHATATMSAIVIAICNLLLIAFSKELITIFAPDSYSEAVSLILPLTMGVYFAFIYNLFVNVQMYYEKTKSVMIISLICAFINLGLNYYFIQLIGYSAAAYTTLASYMLMAVMHFFAMKRSIKKHNRSEKIYDIRSLGVVTFAFVSLSVLFGCLQNYMLVRYFLIFVIVFCIYVKRNFFKELLIFLKK